MTMLETVFMWLGCGVAFMFGLALFLFLVLVCVCWAVRLFKECRQVRYGLIGYFWYKNNKRACRTNYRKIAEWREIRKRGE